MFLSYFPAELVPILLRLCAIRVTDQENINWIRSGFKEQLQGQRLIKTIILSLNLIRASDFCTGNDRLPKQPFEQRFCGL